MKLAIKVESLKTWAFNSVMREISILSKDEYRANLYAAMAKEAIPVLEPSICNVEMLFQNIKITDKGPDLRAGNKYLTYREYLFYLKGQIHAGKYGNLVYVVIDGKRGLCGFEPEGPIRTFMAYEQFNFELSADYELKQGEDEDDIPFGCLQDDEGIATIGKGPENAEG